MILYIPLPNLTEADGKDEPKRGANLLGILSAGASSLSRLGLHVKVDQEEAGQERAEEDGEVGAELDLQGEGLRGEGRDDGVGGEGRGGDGGRDGGDSGLLEVEAGLSDPLGNCHEAKMTEISATRITEPFSWFQRGKSSVAGLNSVQVFDSTKGLLLGPSARYPLAATAPRRDFGTHQAPCWGRTPWRRRSGRRG